jgi:hypothetical protein
VLLVAGCASDHADQALHPGHPTATGTPSELADATRTIPPPEEPAGPGETFVIVGVPDGPYEPAPRIGAADDYRCFLVDPELDEDAFITGVQFLPGNDEIVHHAILYRVPPEQVTAAEERDAAEDGTGWSCFGGSGLDTDVRELSSLDSAPWLAAWAPGGREQRYADHLGVWVEAGSRIVLQVHYNLHHATGTDTTQVRLRMAPGDAGLTPLETMLLPAPVELPCAPDEDGELCDRDNALLDLAARFGPESWHPVGRLQLLCGGDPAAPAPGPTQSCDRTVHEPMTVYAGAGHMHLLGRSISIELNPDTDTATTLLDVPQYNFDNQGSRPLAEPVAVAAGDTVRITCTHDVGLRQLLPALRDEPPRYVVWGDGTTDEMCLGILAVTRP